MIWLIICLNIDMKPNHNSVIHDNLIQIDMTALIEMLVKFPHVAVNNAHLLL